MKATIHNALVTALLKVGVTRQDFIVERPADVNHGDYASNVALVAAKELRLAPREVASKLADVLTETIPDVASIDIAGPGFLNFTLKRSYFSDVIEHVTTTGNDWGKNTTWSGKKVVVEYTDPNPFKEFHVGHLFTNMVGESIARLFVMNGATVKRVNYQGDVGLHVAHALYGMSQLGLLSSSSFTARELGKAYALGATAYKNDAAAALVIRNINKRIYDRTDLSINELYDAGRAISLSYFETIYQQIGTKFDEYFFESEAGPLGKELVLSNPHIFPLSEGARIFKGEEHGLHTRVFINKEGLPTYEAKELALAKLKEDRLGSYDHSVISTSNEVTAYFKVLQCALSFVYPDLAAKTEHVGHGTVRLSSGKMSSRTGEVIRAVDFIEDVAQAALTKMATGGVTEPNESLAHEIAIGAIKYATLHGNVSQDSVFDRDRALSFEGDSGPYLQYTYARIQSILRKADTFTIAQMPYSVPTRLYQVERLLPFFPEVIATSLNERSPHKVVHYLTELAGSFNSFYAQEKIADPSDAHAPYKLTLAKVVAQTLKNGLWVLGITAPERM